MKYLRFRWYFSLSIFCVPLHAATLEALVVNAQGAPVEDTAVIAEPAVKMQTQQARATIAQRDRELTPYLTIVETGTAIDFPNHDALKHHLYSFSPAKHFEIKLYAGKPAQPVIFDKPGEVALGCNIHDWMEAYVYVVDTPYFAKTNKQGRALIKQLPEGKYHLRLWHPRQSAELPAREITVASSAVKTQWVLEVAPRIIKPKPPLESGQY